MNRVCRVCGERDVLRGQSHVDVAVHESVGSSRPPATRKSGWSEPCWPTSGRRRPWRSRPPPRGVGQHGQDPHAGLCPLVILPLGVGRSEASRGVPRAGSRGFASTTKPSANARGGRSPVRSWTRSPIRGHGVHPSIRTRSHDRRDSSSLWGPRSAQRVHRRRQGGVTDPAVPPRDESLGRPAALLSLSARPMIDARSRTLTRRVCRPAVRCGPPSYDGRVAQKAALGRGCASTCLRRSL
jgi:hypothetical protein